MALFEGTINNFKSFFKGIKNLVNGTISTFKEKCTDYKYKLEHLRDTNYNLGLKHLELGNLGDAIFRFRIMRNFWPDDIEVLYQLAYCYMLKNKEMTAEDILEEVFALDKDNKKAKDLYEKIESGESKKIREDYLEKYKKEEENKSEEHSNDKDNKSEEM